MQVSLGVDEIFVPNENMKHLGWKKIGLFIFPITFRSFSPTFLLNQKLLTISKLNMSPEKKPLKGNAIFQFSGDMLVFRGLNVDL